MAAVDRKDSGAKQGSNSGPSLASKKEKMGGFCWIQDSVLRVASGWKMSKNSYVREEKKILNHNKIRDGI